MFCKSVVSAKAKSLDNLFCFSISKFFECIANFLLAAFVTAILPFKKCLSAVDLNKSFVKL